MYCPKCGKHIENDATFCVYCGYKIDSQVSIPVNQINTQTINQANNVSAHSNSFKKIIKSKFFFIAIVLFIILLIIFCILRINKGKYYFSNNNYDTGGTIVQGDSSKKGKHATVIISDNKYEGVKISNESDANKLIVTDSVSQKNKCPSEIAKYEDEIVNKYGITAVNLCEMDVEFAKELVKLLGKIYNEYPSIRTNLTNLTLTNASMSDGYIAAFMPAFPFASTDTSSTYPWVIKTQVVLNTRYFLDLKLLSGSVNDGSSSGHFPPNTTMYSPVAHEFGHYISFLAMLKKYDIKTILLLNSENENRFNQVLVDFKNGYFSLSLIKEAYNEYKNDTKSTIPLDDWRGTISKYALAKDNSGKYIYDETIAEAFHDVYLNGDGAKDASKYIVKKLKEKLGS